MPVVYTSVKLKFVYQLHLNMSSSSIEYEAGGGESQDLYKSGSA